jgi:hypothetical protein
MFKQGKATFVLKHYLLQISNYLSIFSIVLLVLTKQAKSRFFVVVLASNPQIIVYFLESSLFNEVMTSVVYNLFH